MFTRKNTVTPNTQALASLLDSSIKIVGEITFNKGARIDGIIHGNVNGSMLKDNLLIIGQEAEVHGDIRCHSLVVLGKIKGNVSACYIEIRSSATIEGDTCYQTIEMYQGSEINGRLLRQESGQLTKHDNLQPIPLPPIAVT